MNNRSQSIIVLLTLFPVLMVGLLTPAQAITTTIKPTNSIVNSSDEAYTATLNPTGGPPAGFYFLNITIPAGYALVIPASGETVGNYTMLNITSGTNKIIINITSKTNDQNGYLVDVRYSTDYGANYNTNNEQNISNMSIGASTLNITKPAASTAGYINLSLGGTAGPIDPAQNNVTITLAKGTLRNPNTSGSYTWYLEAKSSSTGTPYTSSNVVNIQGGGSTTTIIPTFNASIPANASLPLPSGNLTVTITTTSTVNVSNLVITLRNFTSDPNSSATAGAESLSRIMFIGVDAPALSGISYTATLRVNYSSVVSTLTIPEANLRLYRFNDATSAWELTSGSGVDTANKIVYGNVTGFSTFAIMGAATATPSGGGGGGSGSWALPPKPTASTVTPSIVTPEHTDALIQPTPQQPQPTTSVTAPADEGDTLTGILTGILGFALPKGKEVVTPSVLIILASTAVLLFILKRKSHS